MPDVALRPEFAPSAALAAELQRQFKLSYHVPYAAQGAKHVGFVGKRVLDRNRPNF